jgi:hypothetical protein
MKDRLLTNWSLVRVIYLLFGISIIAQAIASSIWLGVLFGSYFAAMGLFAFGCAGGNCFQGSCEINTANSTDADNIKDLNID